MKLRVWDEAREEALKAECAREVEAAVDEYLSGPKPSTDQMFDHLFANPPKGLAEQREMARRYAGGGGPHASRAQTSGKPVGEHVSGQCAGGNGAGHGQTGSGSH
jgi:pyruvate dehydrogenase E1 component alpha subunit